MRLALLLVLAVLAGACDVAGGAAPPAIPSLPAPQVPASPTDAGMTFRYGLGEPAGVLPGEVTDPNGLVVADAVFDSLTAWTLDGRVIPSAATSWSADGPDGALEWTFTLRPDATWHDGNPVTAADFVYAWTRAAAQGGAGYLLEDVAGYDAVRGGAPVLEGVTAPGPRTLVVRLASPDAEFPAVAGHPALAPLPRVHLEEDPDRFADAPIGNGPYRFAEPWSRGSFIRVLRVPGWRNGDPPAPGELGEVVFFFRGTETAYLDFQQDQLDFAPVPPTAMDGARERYGESPDGYTGPGVLDGRTPQLYFLGFDLDRPPFDQVDVRRAVSLAIDRAELIRRTQGGNADLAGGLVPFAVPGAARGYCATCRHAPELARELFAAAGVTELELWFNAGGGHERVAEVLRGQFAAVGVTLIDHAVPAQDASGGPTLAPYLAAIRGGEAGLFRFGWTLDTPTFRDALTPLIASAAAADEGAGNHGGYADAEVDADLALAAGDLSAASRALVYRRAEGRALDDQAVVPVMTFRHEAVVSDRFTGFALSPFGLPTLTEVRRSA